MILKLIGVSIFWVKNGGVRFDYEIEKKRKIIIEKKKKIRKKRKDLYKPYILSTPAE